MQCIHIKTITFRYNCAVCASISSTLLSGHFTRALFDIISSHNENRDVFRRLVLFARGVITSSRFISLVIREYDQRSARNCSVYIIYLMYIIGHRWYTAAHARISPEDISVSVHPVINHRRGILKENNPPKQRVWACALCVCMCSSRFLLTFVRVYTRRAWCVLYIGESRVYDSRESCGDTYGYRCIRTVYTNTCMVGGGGVQATPVRLIPIREKLTFSLRPSRKRV